MKFSLGHDMAVAPINSIHHKFKSIRSASSHQAQDHYQQNQRGYKGEARCREFLGGVSGAYNQQALFTCMKLPKITSKDIPFLKIGFF